jgi:hypothetical protein
VPTEHFDVSEEFDIPERSEKRPETEYFDMSRQESKVSPTIKDSIEVVSVHSGLESESSDDNEIIPP